MGNPVYVSEAKPEGNVKPGGGGGGGGKSKCKCGAEGCVQRPAPIIGDCAYCGAKFCAQHRLPETHRCDKLKECRETAKTANTERLNSQALSSVMNVGY